MEGIKQCHHCFEGSLGQEVTGRRKKLKGSLCHTAYWGRAMGLLCALEEGASHFLRATRHASSTWVTERTEKGLRAVAFFGGEGVRPKLMCLIEFKGYFSLMSGSKKPLNNLLKRIHTYDISDYRITVTNVGRDDCYGELPGKATERFLSSLAARRTCQCYRRCLPGCYEV